LVQRVPRQPSQKLSSVATMSPLHAGGHRCPDRLISLPQGLVDGGNRSTFTDEPRQGGNSGVTRLTSASSCRAGEAGMRGDARWETPAGTGRT
jgi:hypothetical protein